MNPATQKGGEGSVIAATPEKDAERRVKIRRGLVAAVALALLTIVEYAIAIQLDRPLWWLVPFAILKGWLILDYFMHIRAAFGGEGVH